MALLESHNRIRSAAVAAALAFSAAAAWGAHAVSPVSGSAAPLREVRIQRGAGVSAIARELESAGVIRSRLAFQVLVVLTGRSSALKPGRYALSPASSSAAVADALVGGPDREVEALIPEGSTLYRIDEILAEAGVIAPGSLVQYARGDPSVEGRLFPDRYRFFVDEEPSVVAGKFLDNFREKAEPLLGDDPARARRLVVLASLLEREVPEHEDRRLVAGVLERRLRAGMALQVDASICYAKQVAAGSAVNCLPLDPSDFKIDSPYNTYRYPGLPPGPIGNPGIDALRAALDPKTSPYWYYLSDPKTGKTIFSRTFEEHDTNRARYLR